MITIDPILTAQLSTIIRCHGVDMRHIGTVAWANVAVWRASTSRAGWLMIDVPDEIGSLGAHEVGAVAFARAGYAYEVVVGDGSVTLHVDPQGGARP